MADVHRYGEDQSNYGDIEQILLEAQHRWLLPGEICEILRNFRKFRIAPEPANRPRSGALFLYDRKVLRNFRKDGHNWRKKKDGKTVKEAHERLKAGSIEVLHCYYAHGEENENFGRRSCWMFEEELSHIVLVHYLEVKDVDLKSSYERNHFQSSEDASDQESIEELSVKGQPGARSSRSSGSGEGSDEIALLVRSFTQIINSSTQKNFDTCQIDLATKSPPWTHDLLNVGGLQLAVEDDTIKNGNDVISAGKSYFTATDLVKKGKINATKMEPAKNETSVSYEVLKGHFGMKLEDAAEELGVSRSTLKRLCRQFEIDRWPSHKRNKVNHPLFDHEPSSYNPPTNQGIKDGRTATVKAAYRDDIIMFQLSFSSRMIDLEEEVRKRLKLEIGTFKIKYADEDGDRILLACDADLKNYIHILTSSGKTIKLLVELLEPRTLA